MNPAAISFVISFLIAAFLSGENRRSRCFSGLESSLTSIPCSANSLGTPGMSAGFQANISLLSRRKLVSANSYFAERWVLMIAVFEASPVPRSICLMSTSFGGARMPGFLAVSLAPLGLFLQQRWLFLFYFGHLVLWLQSGLLEHRSQKRASNHFEGKGHH